jgi:multimeric flavodoxin WrbA
MIKDDMYKIYEKINESDIIIFASPNYLGQITGQLKIVYDRLYAFNGEDDRISII